jgi:acyl-CoA thioesterase-1
MCRRILLFLLIGLMPVLAGAAGSPAPHVILVMGDSLSAAFGIQRSLGWVTLLQARLKDQGYDYTVVNASVSGETTSGGVTRLPATLQEHKPGIVILELGANDGLRGLPIPVMHDNLVKMISLSQAEGAKLLLVGVLLPPNYGEPYIKAFAGTYTDLARQYQLPLLPFLLAGVAEHRELLQPDGLHPLAIAEPKVLDNVWPYLKPLLHKQ